MKAVKKRHLSQEEKERILSKLVNIIERETSVLFAYVYGSFLNKNGFNDIDVGVYVDEKLFEKSGVLFKHALRLAAKIDLALENYEVDVQTLNLVPLSFRVRVINSGRLLFSRDEHQRIDFETQTRDLYFDFLPHRKLLYRKIVMGK